MGLSSWLGLDDGELGPLITGLGSLVGGAASLYNNKQNQDQASKQWDAQFAYQQSRDKVADAEFQAKLNAELGAASISAGAQVKAAGIAAAAQNKRTLSDLYSNYMGDIGNQAGLDVKAYQGLGSAMADPFMARKSLRY